MTSDENQMVSLKDAAKIVGVTTGCVYQWQWRGKLHAVQINGRWMTTPAEVRRAADLMDQNPAGRKRLREREELALAGEQEHAAV